MLNKKRELKNVRIGLIFYNDRIEDNDTYTSHYRIENSSLEWLKVNGDPNLKIGDVIEDPDFITKLVFGVDESKHNKYEDWLQNHFDASETTKVIGVIMCEGNYYGSSGVKTLGCTCKFNEKMYSIYTGFDKKSRANILEIVVGRDTNTPTVFA